MLLNTKLWERVEKRCRASGIEFGEIQITVLIQDGIPQEAILEKFRDRIRERVSVKAFDKERAF